MIGHLTIQSQCRKATILALLVSSLSGCTAIKDFLAPLGSDPRVVEEQPRTQKPPLEPISRNYFVLESASQTVIGEPQLVYTSEADTFSMLAREYGLGYDELVAANPDVDPWLPGEGTQVLLPTQYVLPGAPKEGIVLNIASKRLFYYPPAVEGQTPTVMTYPIGIGRVGWETPLGNSTVVAKAKDPHWYVPASVRREHKALGDPLPSVVPPGPDNPLGHRVLKLDLPGYLIHGTNQPYGVGMRVSHGCVRLYPENIELLYEMVGVGEPVMIVNEPYLVGWLDGELYLESHALLEDDPIPAEDRLAGIVTFVANNTSEPADGFNQEWARSVADDALGLPIPVNVPTSAGVRERARVVRNTIEPDPNMPTLDEVRAILDAPPEDEEALEQDTEKVADNE